MTVASIHPTACVADSAQIGPGTIVGPFAVIEEQAVLGENNRLEAYVVIGERTTLGCGNVVRSGAALGTPPQDKKAGKEETLLVVGDENVIGEHVTFHRGTEGGGGITRVGSRGLFAPFSHVAHDCLVGDRVKLGPLTGISGHVTIEEGAETKAHVGVHQFVRLGAWSVAEEFAGVNKDLPPFSVGTGNPADTCRLREDLLEVLGIGPSSVEALRRALSLLRQVAPVSEVLRQISELPPTPEIERLAAFLSERDHRYPDKRRGVIRRVEA